MKRIRVWAVVGIGLALLGLGARIFTLPLSNAVEGPPPLFTGENQVRLEHGTFVRQTLALPDPQPREITLRVWIQLFPAENHFLRARVESAGQVVGQAALPLSASYNAFYSLQTPWWQLPAGGSSVTLVLEGHGVVVLATAVDRVAGGDLEVDGVSQAPADLALQLVSGDRGIERYIPLSRIAAGKPGILGWPRLVLLLMFLYGLAVVVLVGSVARLLRYLEGPA